MGQVLRLHREFKKHLTSKGFKTLHLVTWFQGLWRFLWRKHLRSGMKTQQKTWRNYETPVQSVSFFFWEKTIPFLPESMEVENYPTWKKTTIGGNYFFTSVIMGGRVYHACRLPWLGELLEKTTYQTNTLYGRLSALSWKPDDFEAGNNYMHWTTGFFSNLPSVLAKEAPTKSRGNEMLKHVDSSMINTSSFRWAFPPGVNAKQKWLNKLLTFDQGILESVQVESSKSLKKLSWTMFWGALDLYNGNRLPQALRYTPRSHLHPSDPG